MGGCLLFLQETDAALWVTKSPRSPQSNLRFSALLLLKDEPTGYRRQAVYADFLLLSAQVTEGSCWPGASQC